MLDWSAYQEVNLDTNLVTSLGRDMLLTLLRFLPELGFLNLYSSFLQPSKSLKQVFILGAAEWFDISAGQPCISVCVVLDSITENFLQISAAESYQT